MWVQPKYILKLIKSIVHLLTWFSLNEVFENEVADPYQLCLQCLINISGPGDLILESTYSGFC